MLLASLSFCSDPGLYVCSGGQAFVWPQPHCMAGKFPSCAGCTYRTLRNYILSRRVKLVCFVKVILPKRDSTMVTRTRTHVCMAGSMKKMKVQLHSLWYISFAVGTVVNVQESCAGSSSVHQCWLQRVLSIACTWHCNQCAGSESMGSSWTKKDLNTLCRELKNMCYVSISIS